MAFRVLGLADLACCCLMLLLPCFCLQAGSLEVKVADVEGYAPLRRWGNATLYRIEAPQADYEQAALLIHLPGSRYDIGYAYGYLLAEEISYSYKALLESILGSEWYDELLLEPLGEALDWQWNDYLSKQLPEQYMAELRGVAEGSADAGCSECGRYVTRAILLANLPGDLQDFLYILLNELDGSKDGTDAMGVPDRAELLKKLLRELKELAPGPTKHTVQCSMFAVWGSRTRSGQLFSARNLDWSKDTGINRYKVAMVIVPNDGGIPSVSLGFAGLFGTLAGMSAKGLTVHEANLEEDSITFSGFPWTLRLRYIMEYASNIEEGRQLWAATNNTVGFNHMIASGPDAVPQLRHSSGVVALALETMRGYTAYFADDDPREADATYSVNGSAPVHIGFPMKQAVWRTNHGYDPVIRQHYEWSQAPSSWSMQRYMFMHEAFVSYENQQVEIDYLEAINITAIVGDKGHHPYTCLNNTDGTNVLSVTFQPLKQTVYVAWERSSGPSWRPATCSTYLKLELSKLFQETLPF